MDYLILVNKDKPLDKTWVPDGLVDAHSRYKAEVIVNNKLLDSFNKMAKDALELGYVIDIMSGYRDYLYQDKIYNKLLMERGFAYAFRSIAKAGCSEHQTGLAIDICVYRDNKCYIEREIEEMDEGRWLRDNAYKYGFILRYPKGCEGMTGYNYKPWHFRYVDNVDVAKEIYLNNLTLEEYLEKSCK